MLDHISLLVCFFFLFHLIYSLKCFLMASLGGGCTPGQVLVVPAPLEMGPCCHLLPGPGGLWDFPALCHMLLDLWSICPSWLLQISAISCLGNPSGQSSARGGFVVPFVFAHLTHSLSIFSFFLSFFLKVVIVFSTFLIQ